MARSVSTRVFVALMVLLGAGAPAIAAPRLVASIPPLQALAAEVMAGIGAPDLLIASGMDPHDFQLRPSQARMLAEADMILWVGPALEAALARSIAALARPDAAIALAGRPELDALPIRRGALFPGGVAGTSDPHLWLDPERARALVALLAAELARRDPANASRYDANAQAAIARLAALETRIAARLLPLAGRGFVIQHDALQYFERRFGLRALGAIVGDHHRPPGAAHVAALERAMRAEGVRCVLAPPGSALARTLAAATGARLAFADDLGDGQSYDRLLAGLADALAGCLGE